MDALFFIVVLFAIIALVVQLLNRSGSSTQAKESQYEQHKSLLSAAERSFFGVLKGAVGADYVVVPKVRVADAIRPRRGMSRSDWQSAFNRISAKHFDFLICRATDFGIVASVELDDKSHRQSRRRERDEFLAAAAKEAGLPLLRFDAKSSYSQVQLRESVADVLNEGGGAT